MRGKGLGDRGGQSEGVVGGRPALLGKLAVLWRVATQLHAQRTQLGFNPLQGVLRVCWVAVVQATEVDGYTCG